MSRFLYATARGGFVILFVTFLVGCAANSASRSPNVTALATVPTAVSIPTSVPSATAGLTATAAFTPRPTVLPTASPVPTTALPTSTSMPTLPPSPTALPSQIPTATATPKPVSVSLSRPTVTSVSATPVTLTVPQIAATAVAAAAGEECVASGPKPAKGFIGDPARGKVLFSERGCSSCHGDHAQGGVGPQLAGTTLSFQAVIHQLREPRGVMQRYLPKDQSDADECDVYIYVKGLKRSP